MKNRHYGMQNIATSTHSCVNYITVCYNNTTAQNQHKLSDTVAWNCNSRNNNINKT